MTQYNKQIVNSLKSSFNPPNNIGIDTNIIAKNIKQHLKDLSLPTTKNINTHFLLSRIGYKLEKVIVKYCNYNLSNGEKLYTGSTIKETVKSYKKSQKETIYRKLLYDFLFSEEYINNIKNMKSFHFPDIVYVNKDKNIIKCMELKSSGNNDSTSVPGNIDKLLFNSKNSAVMPWKNNRNIQIYSAIVISAATYNKNNSYPVKNRWINNIDKRHLNIDVCANEEVMSWIIGKDINYDDYYKNIISSACRIGAELIKESLIINN